MNSKEIKLRNWDAKETRLKNIERKVRILDREPQFYEGVPIPSWIELNIIDACNRSCSFCPKSDENIAPNTYQKMEMVLIEKLTKDLKKINFDGAFCLSGYGEPTLHKNIDDIISTLSPLGAVEVITNGDTLNPKSLLKLYNSKLSKLIISLYDGEHQIEIFEKMIKEAGVPRDFVILRHTWYNDKENFGLLLTNRAGTVELGNQPKIDKNKPCFYPSYTSIIEWNGDVFLCCHDWQRRIPLGNIMQKDFFEIWNSTSYNKYRKNLLCSSRNLKPCADCNTDGTVHGFKHAEVWKKHYKL